jgi:hypothetical protein
VSSSYSSPQQTYSRYRLVFFSHQTEGWNRLRVQFLQLSATDIFQVYAGPLPPPDRGLEQTWCPVLTALHNRNIPGIGWPSSPTRQKAGTDLGSSSYSSPQQKYSRYRLALFPHQTEGWNRLRVKFLQLSTTDIFQV